MAMAASLREVWHQLQSGEPGRRFQDRYEEAARDRHLQPWYRRVLKIVGAGLAIAIGLVEIFFPGPAIFFLFVGGALLATESRAVARFMDWVEVTVRRWWDALQRSWRGLSRNQRTLLIATVLAALGVVAYFLYRLFWA